MAHTHTAAAHTKGYTVVTMLLCGGDIPTTYGVYHAKVGRNRVGGWSWNLNHKSTIRVGTVNVPRQSGPRSYRELAEPFATADYPVLYDGLNNSEWTVAK